MESYLIHFFEMFDYPDEARETLLNAYKQICSNEKVNKDFESLIKTYEEDMNFDYLSSLSAVTEICAKADVHKYIGHLLFVICLSKKLREYYEAEGVEERIWFLSMCDLKWKLLECKFMHDIWGSFVADWFGRFFNMTRFAIGKLQFELNSFKTTYERDGLKLTPESKVIGVHIPRTGTRLDRESQIEAYREAAVFFKKRYQLEKVVFVCRSWLLFPRNKEVLSPQSNLYAFASDYEIINQGYYDDYTGVWGIFEKAYTGNVDELPQDTTLRRAYADWIRKGEKTGWGQGVFPFN